MGSRSRYGKPASSTKRTDLTGLKFINLSLKGSDFLVFGVKGDLSITKRHLCLSCICINFS